MATKAKKGIRVNTHKKPAGQQPKRERQQRPKLKPKPKPKEKSKQ